MYCSYTVLPKTLINHVKLYDLYTYESNFGNSVGQSLKNSLKGLQQHLKPWPRNAGAIIMQFNIIMINFMLSFCSKTVKSRNVQKSLSPSGCYIIISNNKVHIKAHV